MANINPSQKEYKNLTKFKFFTLTNFPFIEADFDALTNYELMCKIVEYLNNVIENEQNVSYNVGQLYNAFMELQTNVNNQIEEGFSELNVQNEINQKLDDMASSGQLDELILNAIDELNPKILDESKRVNVVDFDSAFIDAIAPYNLLPNNVLNTINKQYLIQIVEYLIKNNLTKYYFINPNDKQRVIYYTLDIEDYETTGKIYLSAKMYMPALNLSYGDRYFDHAEFSITYENETVTNIEFVSQSTHAYNILRTNNINEYVPANPYAPATKDYVDSHAGGSDLPVYYWTGERYGTIIGCSQYGGVSFDGTDWDSFKAVLNEAHANGDNDFILIMKLTSNSYEELYSVHIENFSDSDSVTTVTLTQFLNSENYRNLLIYGQNNTGSNYSSLGFACSITNGLIDSFMYQTSSPSNNSTFVKAEDIIPTDISNQVSISSSVQAVGVEGIKFMKQGMQYNLHGTITAPNGALWSGATLEIPAEHAPIEFESGVAYTACYTTCILIKASDNSMQYLYSNYAHSADAVAGGFSFTPIASGVTLEAGDVIRFNISYIRKQAN